MRLDRIWSRKDGSKNHLMLGAAVALVLISLGMLKTLLQPSPPPKTAEEVQIKGLASTPDHFSTITTVKENLNAEKRRKALAAIQEHNEAIRLNWNSENTPDRLMAVGNLHQYQLDDYHSAIQNYRSLIDSYPKHAKVAQAYIEIAACYERLGEETQARYVYQEMVQSLDSSLQHVAYAKLKLKGEPAF